MRSVSSFRAFVLELVDWWSEKLGLGAYIVNVGFNERRNAGKVMVDWNAYEADIQFNTYYLRRRTDLQIENTVVHELLHVLFWGMVPEKDEVRMAREHDALNLLANLLVRWKTDAY